MAVWADTMLAEKQSQLIRKALDAVVMVAPIATAVPDTIVDATGANLVVPTGYNALGHHSEDGITWSREVETSDITSHGSVDPTRSDIRRITSTMGVTAQETNLQTISTSLGIDLAADARSATTGELKVDEPSRPRSVHYRLMAVSVDDGDAGEIYIGRLFPRAKVTEVGEQTWSDGDEAMVRPFTFTAYRDATLGVSVRHFFGGPGWKALLDDMGFTAVA